MNISILPRDNGPSYYEFVKMNKSVCLWFVGSVIFYIFSSVVFIYKSPGPDLILIDRPDGFIYVSLVGLIVLGLGMTTMVFFFYRMICKLWNYIRGYDIEM